MKKKTLLLLVVLLIVGVFAFDFFNNLSIVVAGKALPEDYVVLKWGNGDNEVGIEGPYEDFWYFGPGTFDVDKQGNVYIVDQLNERIIKVDKDGNVVDKIDISKIVPQEGAYEDSLHASSSANLLPVQLIASNNCLFLLHHYRNGTPMPFDPNEYAYSNYLSIITKDNIVTLDAGKLWGYGISAYMKRLDDNKIVLTVDVPPEDIPSWKGPKAVIVDNNGKTSMVNSLINGSYDGVTPFASVLYDEDKETHCYRNVRVEVKNPKENKVIFTSQLIDNDKLITFCNLNFNGNKATLMYQDEDAYKYNKEQNIVTTHIAIFTLFPNKEENYTMTVGDEERKDMLPPPFIYKKDFLLGEDGHFYWMLYMKDGLHIKRFDYEVTTTEYSYRALKF